MNPQIAPMIPPKNVKEYPVNMEDINSMQGLPILKIQDNKINRETRIAAVKPTAKPTLIVFKRCFSFFFLIPFFS